MPEDKRLEARLLSVITEIKNIQNDTKDYEDDLENAIRYISYCLDDAVERVNGDKIMRTSGNGVIKIYNTVAEAVNDIGGICSAKMIRSAIKTGTRYMTFTWDYC